MSNNKTDASELRALSNLIQSSVEKIEAALASRLQNFPSMDDPFTMESEAVRMSPDVLGPGSIIIAAAAQLISCVRVPALTVLTTCGQYHISSCMRAAIQLHIPEILREAGTQGAGAKEIAAVTGSDPAKLARVLRLLTTNHIFKEVAPDVFTNNRASSLLDTGKPVAEILKDVEAKHDGTMGLAAHIEHLTDDGFKASSYFPESLISPKTALSNEPNDSAFNLAFETDLSMFPWFEQPENAYRFRRFGIAMTGAQNISSPGAILSGFDWKALPKGAVVVDVGGGVGSQSLVLARAFDHLTFIVQDREPVIKDAIKYWNHEFPKAVESGRVKLEVHDFMTPQPVETPSVFLLRMILHDWADSYSLTILRHLRVSAGPDTQLVIVDNVMSYSCLDTTTARNIPGASVEVPPVPLLPNNGVANTLAYLADVHMLTLMNGVERTVAQFDSVLKEAGWKLVRVHHSSGFEVENAKVFAVPL